MWSSTGASGLCCARQEKACLLWPFPGATKTKCTSCAKKGEACTFHGVHLLEGVMKGKWDMFLVAQTRRKQC